MTFDKEYLQSLSKEDLITLLMSTHEELEFMHDEFFKQTFCAAYTAYLHRNYALQGHNFEQHQRWAVRASQGAAKQAVELFKEMEPCK